MKRRYEESVEPDQLIVSVLEFFRVVVLGRTHVMVVLRDGGLHKGELQTDGCDQVKMIDLSSNLVITRPGATVQVKSSWFSHEHTCQNSTTFGSSSLSQHESALITKKKNMNLHFFK